MDGLPTHWLVQTAVRSLSNLTHRGAIAADGKTGDGCGILLRTPDRFFRTAADQENIPLAKRFAVGMVFQNTDTEKARTAQAIVEQELRRQNLEAAGWRSVPIDPEALGESARAAMPNIEQVFVNQPANFSSSQFELRLYAARRAAEKKIALDDPQFYICSLSSKMIVYKGLVMPENLTTFYPELDDPGLESSLTVFHQRFSTNTAPTWNLAQPFRMLAHNGEINTIQGNRNWCIARSPKFSDSLHGKRRGTAASGRLRIIRFCQP